jgi:hypothetical protein
MEPKNTYKIVTLTAAENLFALYALNGRIKNLKYFHRLLELIGTSLIRKFHVEKSDLAELVRF